MGSGFLKILLLKTLAIVIANARQSETEGHVKTGANFRRIRTQGTVQVDFYQKVSSGTDAIKSGNVLRKFYSTELCIRLPFNEFTRNTATNLIYVFKYSKILLGSCSSMLYLR